MKSIGHNKKKENKCNGKPERVSSALIVIWSLFAQYVEEGQRYRLVGAKLVHQLLLFTFWFRIRAGSKRSMINFSKAIRKEDEKATHQSKSKAARQRKKHQQQKIYQRTRSNGQRGRYKAVFTVGYYRNANNKKRSKISCGKCMRLLWWKAHPLERPIIIETISFVVVRKRFKSEEEEKRLHLVQIVCLFCCCCCCYLLKLSSATKQWIRAQPHQF